jgi:hypothetical protein
LSNKKFVIYTILTTIILSFITSQAIYYSVTTNKLYKYSQQRIKESHDNAKIVFVGDSSLEHAIDEQYFSKLSGIKTSNLALTASAHNLSATYNMIRHVIKNNKDVKIIVMMQNPSVWINDFSLAGYCSTLNNLDSKDAIKRGLLNKFDCLDYHYGNFTELKTKIRHLLKNKKQTKEKTYKNGLLDIDKEIEVNKYTNLLNIGSSKTKELEMINDYIAHKHITLIYLQGSLHKKLAKKYINAINKQHQIIKKQKNITFIEKFLYPENKYMGNTENHVDESYKNHSTRFYYELLKPYTKKLIEN